MKDLLLSLLTKENLLIAIPVLLGGLGLLLGTSEVRKRRIALAVFHGYRIARDIADETPGEDAADIVEAALKAADEYMAAHGWRPLKEGELPLAKLQVRSESGLMKLAADAQSPQ